MDCSIDPRRIPHEAAPHDAGGARAGYAEHSGEAEGLVVRKLAHDVNNVLGAVLGFAKLLAEDLPAGSVERGYAERIVAASERGRDLVARAAAPYHPAKIQE